MSRAALGKDVVIKSLRASAASAERWQKMADESGMVLADWMRHTLDAGKVLIVTVTPAEPKKAKP